MTHEAHARLDLRALPRVGDGWTFLYVQHSRVEREDSAIVLVDVNGRTAVPAAALSVLMLGPGTTVTHSAVAALAEVGCSAVWCGEGVVRFYASGLGETRQAIHLERQAACWADPAEHESVVMRMYRMRFDAALPAGLSLEQVRGREGVRVREAYAQASRETGVPWTGRNWKPGEWNASDPVNRALSAANACLHGLCHAALAATGFAPGLGFIHTGKAMSFVYDVADLYKCDVTVPLAFRLVKTGTENLEGRVRRVCREVFFRERLVERIVPDVQRALGMKADPVRFLSVGADEGEGAGDLWDPRAGRVAGGRNHGDGPEGLPQ